MTKKEQDRVERLSEGLRDAGQRALGLGRNVFMAGIGAVATIEAAARNAGTELIRRGEEFDSPLLGRVREPVSGAFDKLRDVSGSAAQRARTTTAGLLHRAGLPSDDEIRRLIDRVEALTRKVSRLETTS